MNKKFASIAASAVMAAAGMLSCSFAAHAATVDEVAEVARSYGYSEEQIQAGYNEYYSHPEDYPPERLDRAVEKFHEAGGQIVTTGPQEPAPTPTVTTAAGETGSSRQEDPDCITLTASDGTTFTRISREAFIKMSYEEKMAYLRTFTPAQQQAIIDDLSPEEYRSLMQQSPTEQKIQIVDTLSEAAEEMGLNISIDEISDDSLTLAMRNDKGELLNVSTAGISVEDTGYDRRGILAGAGALVCAGAAAVYFLMRRTKADGSEN